MIRRVMCKVFFRIALSSQSFPVPTISLPRLRISADSEIGYTVLAVGLNQVVRTFDPSAHGEVVAIRKACEIEQLFSLANLDAILYTTCEPCMMCSGLIRHSRMRKVNAATTAEDALIAGFGDRESRTEFRGSADFAFGGVEYVQEFLREEALPIFELYARLNGIVYC
jgi:guanine deaminase